MHIRIDARPKLPAKCTIAALGVCTVLAGCAITPSSVINQEPAKIKEASAPSANGTIFNAGTFRPQFSNVVGRNVGDTITVILNESTRAGKQGTNSSSKSGSFKGAVTGSGGYPFIPFIGNSSAGGSATSDSKVNDAGSETASNTFNGSITVQIIDVQPNGNLVVRGEKQVSLDRGVEYIRFSGVVFPYQITPNNQILSSQVADVRVEYRSSSQLDMAAVMSAFSRFFQILALPF
ncbi:MAG: flagellar basal body L-ring protein FlgH [Proteobacteria bacterium]|nr:flagellar basal body L-ring protein FlgH [Pseudomonadota bacterium]